MVLGLDDSFVFLTFKKSAREAITFRTATHARTDLHFLNHEIHRMELRFDSFLLYVF